MPRIAHMLSLLSLLLTTIPAMAADQRDPQCLRQGYETAARDWVDDPDEMAQIAATNGRVLRIRNALILNILRAPAETFLDHVNVDEETSDCSSMDNATYRLLGIAGQHALIENTGYEYVGLLLVNMITGRKYDTSALNAPVSPGGRYLVPMPSGIGFDPDFAVYDLAGRLKTATFVGYSSGFEAAVWTDPHTALVTLQGNNGMTDATLTIDGDQARLKIADTGQVIAATFGPPPYFPAPFPLINNGKNPWEDE